MRTPYEITHDAWTAITDAGKWATAYLDIDGNGEAGTVDVRVYQGESAPGDSDLTDSPRIFKPSGNDSFFSMRPGSSSSIFYLRTKTAGDTARVIVDSEDGTTVSPNKVETIRQSNSSPWNDFYFVQENGDSTTLTAAVVDPMTTQSRTLSVASIANISVGDWLGVFTPIDDSERYYWAEVISITGLDLEMQTLIDYPFPIGSTVKSTTKNLAVDGSTTPQVFSVIAGSGDTALAIDISRIMMAALTDSAVSLSAFGDISGGLTNGLYFRVVEETGYRNKLIAKDNFDLAKFAYDFAVYEATNPAQGQDGFCWRFSLGGEDKHDAMSRVEEGGIGALEIVVQDDLSSITTLEAVVANSEVTD